MCPLKEGYPTGRQDPGHLHAGRLFTIDNELTAGAELDLTMTLPPEVTGGTEVLIKATGKVVRVDKRSGNGDQKIGVAAVFEMHDIVRNQAAIA